jgi:photosystem II stability/assembly factor-like uncharacterized protein
VNASAVFRQGVCASLMVCGLAAAAAQGEALKPPLARPAIALRNPQHAAMMGLAHAGDRLVAVGEHGTVLLSDDAGGHWRQAASVPVSATLTAAQFINARTGWAVGHYGVILRSDDGGDHWTRQLDGLQAAQLRLAEAKDSGQPKLVAEARRMVQEGADKPLLALHFQNDKEGLASGAFGLLLATGDGGATWRSLSARLDNPKGAHLYALQRDGAQLLLAGEQGLLLHSADGGTSFQRIATPYQGSWFCAAFEADGGWLLAGLRGNVQRSRDQGKTWVALNSPAPVSFTTSLKTAQGAVWLANQGGQVMAATAGSERLTPVAGTPSQQPAAMWQAADGTLLLAGWNGITRVQPTKP